MTSSFFPLPVHLRNCQRYSNRKMFTFLAELAIHRNRLRNLCREEGVAVLIVSLETAYYVISIITLFCDVAYKIGYEHGKNAKK